MGIADRKAREFTRREEEILAAALALLDSDEWLSVTVEQIAQRAEIGKGTIYKHFPSKHALYARLALDFHHGLLAEFDTIDESLAIPESFRLAAGGALRYHLAHPEYRRVVLYCKRRDFIECLDDELKQQFEALDEAFDHFSYRLLEHGIEAGIFADRPREATMMALYASFEGAIYTLWEGGGGCRAIDHQLFIDSFIDFIFAGLKR